ncbi:hypothetical protein L3X38_016403 [Prunus dulcis]|uniref:Reverse transcriptase zinc-binding domain-containing protein n=1 Tax=Prunus dulcis TaxID=3755 RepID=A0AAD4Z950_PRUDU|nr:hypothetical protein L3X38_016403 [Prunus dulcis]
MTLHANCYICGAPVENVDHIVRNCLIASLIWRQSSLPVSLNLSQDDNMITWAGKNLHNYTLMGYGVVWSTLFAFTCWFLWKWRNKKIFDPGFVFPSNPNYIILLAAADWQHVNTDLAHKPIRSPATLSWQYPAAGVTKINTDGCRSG